MWHFVIGCKITKEFSFGNPWTCEHVNTYKLFYEMACEMYEHESKYEYIQAIASSYLVSRCVISIIIVFAPTILRRFNT